MSYQLSTAIERIKFAREAGAVRRLHIHRIIGEYDIAQHSYGALCLLRVLNPDAPTRLLWAILSHDKPERLTGDIPSPAKYNGQWFDKKKYAAHEDEILVGTGFDWDELSEDEEQWLKAVDALEFYLFCLDQDMLGNRTVVKPRREIERYIEMELDRWPEPARELYLQLRNAPSLWEMCDELG